MRENRREGRVPKGGALGCSLQAFFGKHALYRQLEFTYDLAVCKGWGSCWRGPGSLQ